MTHHDNPARMKAHIASYDDARRFYESSRAPHKLGHNTYVHRTEHGGHDAYGIVYHSTPIVIYSDDGRIVLNSGRYRTATTKSHMNSVLPPGIRVYQKQYDWYVSTRDGDKEFFDGMTLVNYWHDPRTVHGPASSSYHNPARRRPRYSGREAIERLHAAQDRAVQDFEEAAAARGSVAYRGYLIRHQPHLDQTWIEKDGAHIGYARDVAHARKEVDGLIDPLGNPSKRSDASKQFFNGTLDVQWLRETHLKHVPGIRERRFNSFILYGNLDAPNRLELYAKRDPTIYDKPIAVLVDDGQGSYGYDDNPVVVFDMVGPRKVRVSRAGVGWFNAQWPGSTLRPSRSYWFEFGHDGDLVDTDVPEHDDGPAAQAMSQDAQAWLEHGTLPAWAP